MISNEGIRSLPAGIYIQQHRKERGWTQEQLAERVGTTKATISKIERSTMRIHSDWLRKFAEAFDVPPAHLVGRVWPPDLRKSPMSVPVVGKIAAGNWREAVQNSDGFIAAVGVGKSAFALEVYGNSMDRVVPPGAYAVIDPGDVELRDGKIYAIMNGGGDTTLKRYRAEPARLLPESTDESHQPILLGQHPVQVIGRVAQIVNFV